MPSGAEVQRDRASGRETVLRLSWRCEPLHLSFPLTHGPGRILGTIARIAVLPVVHTGLDLAHGCPGACESVTITRGMYIKPLRSFRKNPFAAAMAQWRCTRISRIW